jgi:hypothetical protein
MFLVEELRPEHDIIHPDLRENYHFAIGVAGRNLKKTVDRPGPATFQIKALGSKMSCLKLFFLLAL